MRRIHIEMHQAYEASPNEMQMSMSADVANTGLPPILNLRTPEKAIKDVRMHPTPPKPPHIRHLWAGNGAVLLLPLNTLRVGMNPLCLRDLTPDVTDGPCTSLARAPTHTYGERNQSVGRKEHTLGGDTCMYGKGTCLRGLGHSVLCPCDCR